MVAVLNVEVVEDEETKNSLGLRLQKHVRLSLNIFGKYDIYGETALSLAARAEVERIVRTIPVVKNMLMCLLWW